MNIIGSRPLTAVLGETVKKFLIVMLAVLGFMNAAHAQDFSLRFGPNFTLAPGFNFGIGAELNGKNLVKFDSSLSLGLYGNLALGFGGGSVSFNGAVGPTINFGLNRGLGNVYAGLALGLAGGGGGTSFIFGFVSGVDYLVSPSVNLFSHLVLVVVPGFFGTISLGADFALSRAIDAFAELQVGFTGTFGLGIGLKFGF